MERRPVALEHSDVGTALRDEVGDNSMGCILQSLMGPLTSPGLITASLGLHGRSRRRDLTQDDGSRHPGSAHSGPVALGRLF